MKTRILIVLLMLLSFAILAQQTRSVPGNVKDMLLPVVNVQNELFSVKGDEFQDFESFTDFTLVFSPWTTRDVDGSLTYGITDYTFPHSGEAMSFIVFNPGETTPSLLDDAAILPHTGMRYAACFASQTHTNDDWLISPKIAMGQNGLIRFWVKSYTSTYGLERYQVGVSTTNTNPSSFTIISPGSYLEAPADAWQQKQFDLSAYAGQDIYVGIQCVSDDAFILMIDDIEIVSQSLSTSTLTGKVTDAVNGNPVANALVSVAGMSDTTDVNGNYVINNIPYGALNANFNASVTSGDAPLMVQFTDLSTEGTHAVIASAEGYISYSNNQVVIPDDGLLEMEIALSPSLEAGQYRFVLTWSESPADLDAHLLTPIINDTSYHIFYENQGSAESAPYALLDIDNQFGFGPETITIYELREGEYRFYVHNYTGTPDISLSNAVVQIFNEDGLVQTLQVPVSGTGQYWDICTINGSSGKISILNKIVTTQPGGSRSHADQMPLKTPVDPGRNIISWSWNFGDGGTSTNQNPTHNYSTNGTYTVSLTVSDYFTSNTRTRTGFIQAGPIGVDENEPGSEVDIYPNPVTNELHISAGFEINSVSMFDISGQQILTREGTGTRQVIKTGDLPAGIYMIRIDTEKGRVSKRILVVK